MVVLFLYKKASVSVLLGQKLFSNFCGTTRFGAIAPAHFHIQSYMLPC